MESATDGTAIVLGIEVFACIFILTGLVWIIREVIADRDMSLTAKTIWIIVLIGAPILGIIAWSVIDSRPRTLEAPRTAIRDTASHSPTDAGRFR